MHLLLFAAIILFTIPIMNAMEVVIAVGGDGTNDVSTLFYPAQAVADVGDTIYFNFTQGNHSVIQSTFGNPCVSIHQTNATYNGFNSGPRDTVGGMAITNLQVTVVDTNPIWYYDANTCAEGGVGGINIDLDSDDNLAAARRNAVRLNGTASASSTSFHSSTAGSTATATSAETAQTSTNGAAREHLLSMALYVAAIVVGMVGLAL